MSNYNFKHLAGKHQLIYFYGKTNPKLIEELELENQQNYFLSAQDGNDGKVFYDGYDIFQRITRYTTIQPQWIFDTLNKKNIAYNFFLPLTTEKSLAIRVFNHLYGLNMESIYDIDIQFPRVTDNPLLANIVFQAYIAYRTLDEGYKFIGFEIKFSEGAPKASLRYLVRSYGVGPNFFVLQSESGLFHPETVYKVHQNAYSHTGRTHLLGHLFREQENFDDFLFVNLYPEGNESVVEDLNEYQKLLTDYGQKTFATTTFEDFFAALSLYAETDRQRNWIQYLNDRYIVKTSGE
ncbi:MAG: hypothetical protein WCL14_09315 [Bacteroidota bacterium]